MLTAPGQAFDWLGGGSGHHVFLFFFAYVWCLWLTKSIPALFYRPFRGDGKYVSASVIIPVVDEPPNLFREVLSRVARQWPHETIVVLNGRADPPLAAVCAEFALRGVRTITTSRAGKRNALRLGIEGATGDVLVLVDSDTLWAPDTLAELLKPFSDPTIGGVTTQQRVADPSRTILTRFADWLESARCRYSMPAQSALGQVGCLPGRTIAVRRQVAVDCLPQFLRERFLWVPMEYSDDRSLTSYVLRAGYRTVYQRTAVVWTDAPTSLRKFLRQQLRWSKGSQYGTLRSLSWLPWRAPLAFLHLSADLALPWFLLAVNIDWAFGTFGGGPSPLAQTPYDVAAAGLGLGLAGAVLGLGLRHAPYYWRRPRELALLPVYAVLLGTVMLGVRLVALLDLWRPDGWGTRRTGGRIRPPR